MAKPSTSLAIVSLVVGLVLGCAISNTATPTPPTPTPTLTPTATRTATPTPTPTPTPDVVKVLRVIDGDTIEIEGGKEVRYIGVNAPESTPGRPVECFGQEARAKNKKLVEGKAVRLEKDISETDRYGRLLRYVWLGDVLVNEFLVAEGYAIVDIYKPDVKHLERLWRAGRLAREQRKGLHAACPPPSPSGPCDPSYPDVCIPSPPPALRCPEIPYKNFRVLLPDPHEFDGNKDGIGCER